MYGDRTKIERTNGDPQCCVLIGGKLNLLPAPLIAPLRVYLRRGSGGGGGNYLSLSERSLSSRDEMNVASNLGVLGTGSAFMNIMALSRGKKYILLASLNVMLGSASVLLRM